MWETAFNLHLANWPAALLAGIPLLITLWLFAYAQRRLPRDSRTLLFEMFLFGILWWQAFDLMVRLSASPETAQFWRGLLRFGQIFAIPVGLQFALTYAEFNRLANNRLFIGLLYAHALLLFGFYQNGQIVEKLVYHPGWGYLANGADFSPEVLVITNIGALLALATSLVLLYNAWHVRGIQAQGEAAALMAVGHLLPALGGIVTEVVLPNLGYHQWPITGSTVTFFAACAALALTRFNMFSVSTPAAAKAVLETITDPMLIARSDGCLLYANNQAVEVFGIDAQRIQTYHLGSLFPNEGDAMAFFAGRWRDALAGQRFMGLDAVFRQQGDVATPFLVSLAPIPITRQGEPGVALVAHDVSRLKRVEADLVTARDAAEEANRSKSMFLANMSHELRTPLNAIIGYAELLEEDLEEPEAREDLGRIHTSGRYLLALIDDVLDLAKVESGKLEVHPVSFDLVALITELRPAAVQLAERNVNRYEVVLPDQPRPLFADLNRTRQVILNLLSNASKFTEHGTITVVVEQTDDQTTIDIRDTGIGMNEEQLSKLFGSFIQVHESNHGKYGGTGLGLALSRKLCQLMNGDITVKSEPGQGTTFTVALPTG